MIWTLNFDEVLVSPPQCIQCIWLDDVELQCAAFEDTPIPEEIQLNLHNHRFAFEGDGGVRFIARS